MSDITINREALVEHLASATFFVNLHKHRLIFNSSTSELYQINHKRFVDSLSHRATLWRMTETLLSKDLYTEVIVESIDQGDRKFQEWQQKPEVKVVG